MALNVGVPADQLSFETTEAQSGRFDARSASPPRIDGGRFVRMFRASVFQRNFVPPA
jgi:hypothetical protein